MASNLKFAVALKNAQLNSITSQVGTSGNLLLYTGTQPTNPDTALSGNTLLVTLPLSSTMAPSAGSGVLTLNTITSANAVANGTATWGSLVTSGGTRIVDLSCGTSGADINLGTTSITSGLTISITAATITSNN